MELRSTLRYAPTGVPVLDPSDGINRSLVIAYPLNLPALGARDISRRKLHGTLTNFTPASWKDGPNYSGGALSFDGVNDYVATPAAASFGAIPLSIELWAYCTSATAQVFLNNWTGISNGSFYWAVFAGSLYAGFFNGFDWTNALGPVAVLPLNAWTHVVLTIDSTNGNLLYVNGKLRNSNATAPTNSANITGWQFGHAPQSGWDFYHPGRMRGLRVWNRTLSATEVRRLWREPSAGWLYPEAAHIGISAPSIAVVTPPVTVTVEEMLRKHGAGRDARLYAPPHKVIRNVPEAQLRDFYKKARKAIPERLQVGLVPLAYQIKSRSVTVMPKPRNVDFGKLADDINAVRILIAAYEAVMGQKSRQQRRRADEERLILAIADYI